MLLNLSKRTSKKQIIKAREDFNSGKVPEPVEAGVGPGKVVDVAPLLDRERLRTVAA